MSKEDNDDDEWDDFEGAVETLPPTIIHYTATEVTMIPTSSFLSPVLPLSMSSNVEVSDSENFPPAMNINYETPKNETEGILVSESGNLSTRSVTSLAEADYLFTESGQTHNQVETSYN